MSRKTRILSLVGVLIAIVTVIAIQRHIQVNSSIARVHALGGQILRQDHDIGIVQINSLSIYGVILRGEVSQTREYQSHGITVLAQLGSIKVIDLTGTDISDSDIGFLAGIHSLTGICLEATTISNQAIKRFRDLRPEVEIILPNSKPLLPGWSFDTN